jgi:hypothetical protein
MPCWPLATDHWPLILDPALSRDIPPRTKQICIFSSAGRRFPQRVIRKARRFRRAQLKPICGREAASAAGSPAQRDEIPIPPSGKELRTIFPGSHLLPDKTANVAAPLGRHRFGSFPENFSFQRHKSA